MKIEEQNATFWLLILGVVITKIAGIKNETTINTNGKSCNNTLFYLLLIKVNEYCDRIQKKSRCLGTNPLLLH